MTFSNKISIRKLVITFCQYLIALICVVDSRSVYVHIGLSSSLLLIFKLGGITIGLIGIILFSGDIKTKKMNKAVTVAFFTFIYLAIYIFFSTHYLKNYMKLSYVFILLLIYYIIYERENTLPELLVKIENIVLVIAAVSLVFWIFGSVIGIIKNSGYSYSDWSNTAVAVRIKNYYYLYFETQESSLGNILSDSFTRNSAIFVEAPMASFYFSIAFLVESLREKNKLKMSILAAAIISTLSITGYIVIIMYFTLNFIQKKKTSSFAKFIKAMMIPVVILIVAYVGYTLISRKMETKSGNLRIDDIIVCLRTWIQHPVFGVGIGNNNAIFANMDGWRRNLQGLSSGLFQVLAHGGIYIFGVYAFALVSSFIHAFKIGYKDKCNFIIIFTFIFAFAIISYMYLTLFIVIWLMFGNKDNFERSTIWEKINQLK